MFTVIACHRCSSLYRPQTKTSPVGGQVAISSLTNGRRLCPECRRLLGNPPDQPRFSSPRRWQAADTFSGETRRLVTALKYRNCTAAVATLADQMVSTIRADRINSRLLQTDSHSGHDAVPFDPVPFDPVPFDVVTWAPTSAHRRRRRGYDQSELLARAVARRLGLPCRRLLVRDRSRHQTGRSRRDRLENGPVFKARPMRRPSRVLVIDDVVTTGSTLRAAGHALDLAGAAKVVLFAAASTPQGGSSKFPKVGDTPRRRQASVPTKGHQLDPKTTQRPASCRTA